MGSRLPLAIIAVLCIALVGLLVAEGGFPLPRVNNPSIPTGVGTPPGPGPNWTRINTGLTPPANASMMGYSPSVGGLVLVTTGAGCGPSSFTWELLGGTWVNVSATVGPGPTPARSDGGIVYDGSDGYLVLFGGYSACGMYNDTWSFSNNSWSRLTTATAPPPLYGFAMTYDASDGYVLLTGGCCVAGKLSQETWAFHHGTWANLTRGVSPAVDLDGAMTYDATLGVVVYVDGYASGYVSQSTWTFHAGNWTRSYPSGAPVNRAGMGFVYDPVLTEDLLVGGYAKVTKGVWVNLTDTWAYVGQKWKNLTAGLTTTPPFTTQPNLMVYDPSRKQVVLFAATNGTWTFG